MKQRKLLEEIFDSPEAGGLRQASLEAGLRALRGKRRRRIAARCVASICVLGFAAAGVVRVLERNERNNHPVPVAGPGPEQKIPPSPGVEIIDADQLLALFPNRPVALVGPPGKRKLVFLDEPSKAGNP